MPKAEITVLGSGTCAATRDRSMASYHLAVGEMQLLLDIGDGALRRLLEAGLDYRQIDAILISHHHIDHVADLVPFLWATRYSPYFQRENPLTLFGPPGTKEWYDKLALAYGDWLLELPFPLIIEEGQNTAWQWQGIAISTRAMVHSVPANGYRLSFGAQALAYTGDTGYHENVIQLAKDADLLIIESSFPDERGTMETHLTPGEAGRIAAAANVRKVILTHLYPECENVDIVAQCRAFFHGQVEIAEDLKTISLPLS